MNACVKTALALSCVFAVSCSGKSDKKDSAPVETPAPVAPAPTPTSNPTPAPTATPEPAVDGFRFVDDSQAELPLYVRGDMNGWLPANAGADVLAASRLNFQTASGCYEGTLNLKAGATNFRLAAFLPGADGVEVNGKGWSYLKVGLGAAGTSTALTLSDPTQVDVYYFPAGDANGKDLGGGGNLLINFPKDGDYNFRFCVQPDDYQKALLTVSSK